MSSNSMSLTPGLLPDIAANRVGRISLLLPYLNKLSWVTSGSNPKSTASDVINSMNKPNFANT